MDNQVYETIYQSMQEGLYVFDASGNIVQINPSGERILGYKADEIIGYVGHYLFHAHAKNNLIPIEDCPIFKAFKAGKPYSGEEIFCTKSGDLITVEVSCTPLNDSQMQSGYLVMFRDITARKKEQEEMLAFSKIVKETKDIIVIKDLDLRILATNQAFADACGKKSPQDVIGLTDAEAFGMDQQSEPIKSYTQGELKAQQLPQGKSLEVEEPVVYPDGMVRIFKTRKFPIYNTSNELIATANISVDITHQKELETKLKQQVMDEVQKRAEGEAFYNRIFETANLGICLTDKDGRFVVVNPAYCNIYGYTQSELIGNHFTMVVPNENHNELIKLHDKFIDGSQEELPQEWNAVGKNGRQIHIVATAGRLDNIVGGPYKITTITDMTDAYKTRKLQQKQEVMLIQQSKLASMGEMLGAIAHQWRQPLNVINCTTLDLRLKKEMGLLDDMFLEKAIKELSQMTNSMSKTIDDFMNFFRPNKTKTFFSLYTCVTYAVDILAAQLNNHGVRLENLIDPKVEVFGAIGELEQVVLNIISNARDAYDEQELEQKPILIYSNILDNRIELIIEDEAGGIDEKAIDKIFEPYFTTKGDNQGTGIGLYMCSIIMEKTFAGTIKAENYRAKSGQKGIRMIMRFPYQERDNESN